MCTTVAVWLLAALLAEGAVPAEPAVPWPPPGSTNLDAIERVAAVTRLPYVLDASSRPLITRAAPRAACSTIPVVDALDGLADLSGLCGWRSDGAWVWFAGEDTPRLLSADVENQRARRRMTAPRTQKLRGSLDLRGASFEDAVTALSLAFDVSVVYTEARHDTRGPQCLDLAFVTLPTALALVGESFGVEARLAGAVVAIRPADSERAFPASGPCLRPLGQVHAVGPVLGGWGDHGLSPRVDRVLLDGDAVAADISELARLCRLLEVEDSIIGP